jgi:hypothetical protein
MVRYDKGSETRLPAQPPAIYNMHTYVADMDEMLKKAQARKSVVGRETVCSLAFADDLVIVAKSGREMKEMMRSLGK